MSLAGCACDIVECRARLAVTLRKYYYSSNKFKWYAGLRHMEGSFAQRAKQLRQAWDGPALSRARRLATNRVFWFTLGPILVVLVAVVWFLLSTGSVSTDNATVAVARVAISSSVRGRIVAVEVRDNQFVRAGDVLLRLDDTDYRAAVADAQAHLANERLEIESARAQYAYAQDEYARQRRLFAAGVASRRDVENAARAATVASHEAGITGGRLRRIDQHPRILQAQAALTQAQNNLNNTEIKAPQDGVVARVDQIQIGSYSQPAQTLFWLISGDPWIDAAFKEDQLENIRSGQPVRVHIDAYPDEAFQGRVVSMSPGTGSSFSVLPANNASGNWVKVVQRVVVRIALVDAPREIPLVAGLSASVRIDTREPRQEALRGREP
jgi:membrane fusion protein, multidrug efflux system